MNYTTLNKIKAHSPCDHGWKKLLKSLGKKKADDEPVSLLHILNSNGLDDALWALRASDASDRECRLYAFWCARQVQHLMTDQRSLDALDVAERHANGDASYEELKAAWAAALDAARAAAWAAALDAARAAAMDAARAALAAGDAGDAWDAAMAAQKQRFTEVFCQEEA